DLLDALTEIGVRRLLRDDERVRGDPGEDSPPEKLLDFLGVRAVDEDTHIPGFLARARAARDCGVVLRRARGAEERGRGQTIEEPPEGLERAGDVLQLDLRACRSPGDARREGDRDAAAEVGRLVRAARLGGGAGDLAKEARALEAREEIRRRPRTTEGASALG